MSRKLILNMPRSAPHLHRRRPIRKSSLRMTEPSIKSSQHILTINFHSFLRKMAFPQQPRPTNPLISFLNLNQRQPEPSLSYIPSIENMISQPHIEDQPAHSLSSIEHGFSQQISSEQTYQLRVLYICLLEKIMRQLQNHTSTSQRKKIIRGTWNILVKYAKDNNYMIFNHIGTQIEWGLLELLNFNFNPSFKQKYHAQNILRKKDQPICSQLSLKFM